MSPLFDQVGDGVFRRRYELLDQNIGVVIGGEAVAVIDTRSAPSHGAEIAADIARLTPLPVGWVINTHWHWDHVLGNSEFPDAEFWGHRRCREMMLASPDSIKAGALHGLGPGLREELEDVDLVAPGNVFDRDAVVDVGGRLLHLAFRGNGHTDADITIRVDEVMFAGDLLEQGAPPSFGDSYPLQWPATIERHLLDSPRAVVPGHGDVMGAAAVSTQIAELNDVAHRCAAAAASAADLDLEGAPYPVAVMKQAYARSLLETG